MSLFLSPIGSLGHRGLRDSSTWLTPFPSNFLSEPGLILSSVLRPSHPLCHSGEGAPAAGRKRLARVVTHGDPDCNSPKFSVTQKGKQKARLPHRLLLPSPSSQPDGPTGWGGEGTREKRADCAKENRRDRDGKRQETERLGEIRGRGGLVILQLRSLGGAKTQFRDRVARGEEGGQPLSPKEEPQ